MPDPQQTAATGSSAAPSIPVLPTLNPEDSPYKPLDLPQQQVSQPAPPPDQKPPADLGAVSHAGAAAYLIDNVLKGASHGAAVGMQYAADQYNKKLSAVQSLYNDQAQQLYTIAKEGRAGTFTGPPDASGKPTFVPSAEFNATKGRMLAAWQAMMQTVGQRIPNQGGKKGKKQVPAGAQGVAAGGPADQSALLTAALDHKGDPQGSLAAIYQLGVQIGPPVVHQITGFLTPEYNGKAQQAAQTEQYQSQEAGSTAEFGAKKAAAQTELINAEASGDATRIEKAKKTLEDLQEATSPYRRPTEAEQKRADYQALATSGQIPKNRDGNPMSYEEWSAYSSTQGHQSATPPKVPKYDNNTGTISDPNTGKVYTPRDLDLPLSIASMFKAADDQAFKKQQRSLQQIAARGNAYLQGRVVQVADPSQPGTTIYMRALDAIKQGVPTPSSIWYKMEMPTGTERARADLAVSAREQLNTMDQILNQRSDLFGPGKGQYTDFTKWVGSQDPDAQRFAAAARIAADHLAGVFGGRSKAALDAIYDAIGQNKTNPAAAIAALEQMNIAAAAIQGRGQAGPGIVPPVARTAPTTAPTATHAPATKPSAGGFDWSAHPVAQ